MVSFFALFTGKKRRKSTARPASPNGDPPRRSARPSSPTRQRSSTRFLSLRSRNAKPYDLQRRQSAEAKRRRSVGTAIARPDEEAPRLTLGWEGRARTIGLQSKEGFLGLDAVGRPPKLSQAEVKVVSEQRWSCEEVMQGWKWFGASLRDSNLETLGLMLPLRMGQDKQTQNLLLALFTLSIRPKLSLSFPSLTDHYPTAPAEHGETSQDEATWTERLLQSLKELSSPIDTAEALKFLIRRLSPSPVPTAALDPSSPTKPFLDDDIYAAFVRGEQESSYNLQAYELIFLPRLRLGLGAYLDELFEVWAVIAARGDVNKMGGGRLPLLLGWWVWGLSAKGDSITWGELFKEWKLAGSKVEHLFYAWIRNQSTKQKQPTRLLQLVERYPFSNQYQDDEAPRPPPSTFPRQTLHVSLQTTSRVARPVPASELLQKAIKAEIQGDGGAPLFQAVRAKQAEAEGEEQHPLSIDEIVADDSKRFLKELDGGQSSSEKPATLSSGVLPRASGTPVDDQPLYRPFSMVSQQDLSGRMARRRSQSLSDGELKPKTVDQVSPLQALSEEVESLISGSPSRLKKRPSESNIRSSSNGVGNGMWESFEQSGFGNTPEPDLQLSPPTASLALSPDGDGPISAGFEKIDMPSRKRVSVPVEAPPVIMREEVLEVDDLFIAFVEDAQLDPSTSTWPSFALVRLASPISRDESKPIEWLLVTLEYQAPPEPTPAEAHPKRSISPGAVSTSSKFGSSLGLFRRTSSSMSIRNNAGRRSIFGSTHRPEPKHSRSATNLAPLPESQSIPLKDEAERPLPGSAVSTAPTEYTITDVGDMVKIPSAADELPLHFDPSGETKPKDWVYRTEGGAHFIFAYRGSSTTYANRILRVRKGVTPEVPDDDVRTVWAKELLPKLLSRDLLLRTTPVELQEKWLKDVLKAELPKRSKERQQSDSNESLLATATGATAGWIMDDVLGKSRKDETVLCIEIKPKWGSLPSAKHIHPAEAIPIKSQIARYRLHEHFRDPASAHGEKYNPLDLYSGEQVRMRKALEGLWAVWESSEGKKNNWRINVDGKAVLPNKASSIPIVGTKKPVKDSTLDLLLPSLISSDVLTLIGSLQSHLDPTDISDLANRYKAAHPDSELFDSANTQEPTAAEVEAFVTKYLENPDAGVNENGWSFRERLIAFSLAATFKDCSIMVRLPLAKASGAWQLSSNPAVKVVDTDLKPLKSLRKWYDLDEQLWRHWLEHPPEGVAGTKQRDVEVVPPTESAIRPKAFTSPSAVEGSSVRAVYVPTPDRSAPATPMEPQMEELTDFPGVSKATTTKAEGVTLAAVIVPTASDVNAGGVRDREIVTKDPHPVVEPTTPVRMSINAKRGSEPVSLADALAITPSASHFALTARAPKEDDEDVVRPLQELPVEQNSPLAVRDVPKDLTADKPLPIILESSPSNQEDVSAAAKRHDQGVPPAAPAAIARAVEAIPEPPESTSESPIIERTARSLAPSPSPHPDATDSPVTRNAELEEEPTHDSHLIVPPTEVSITSPVSELEPVEASHDAESVVHPSSDRKPTEEVAASEHAASEDDKKTEEAETSQSGIFGMAGTAAAVSAAAVVGALGAVAGVAAAAVDVASPTKSTFGPGENKAEPSDRVEEEHAVEPDHTADGTASIADRTEHSPNMPGGPEALLEETTPGTADETHPVPDEQEHDRFPIVAESTPDTVPQATPVEVEPPASPRAPTPVSPQGDLPAVSAVKAEPTANQEIAEAEQEHFEGASATSQPLESTVDAVGPSPVSSSLPADNRTEASHELSEGTREQATGERPVPRRQGSVAARVAAFEGLAEPVERTPSPASAAVQSPADPDPAPRSEQLESHPISEIEPLSDSLPVEHGDAQLAHDETSQATEEAPTALPGGETVAESVLASPKAVKRSTFGQVEEETAKDLAQIHGGPVESAGIPVDEPAEIIDHVDPDRDVPEEQVEQRTHDLAPTEAIDSSQAVDHLEESVAAPHVDSLPVATTQTAKQVSDETHREEGETRLSTEHVAPVVIQDEGGISGRLADDQLHSGHGVQETETAVPVDAPAQSHGELASTDEAHTNPEAQRYGDKTSAVPVDASQAEDGSTEDHLADEPPPAVAPTNEFLSHSAEAVEQHSPVDTPAAVVASESAPPEPVDEPERREDTPAADEAPRVSAIEAVAPTHSVGSTDKHVDAIDGPAAFTEEEVHRPTHGIVDEFELHGASPVTVPSQTEERAPIPPPHPEATTSTEPSIPEQETEDFAPLEPHQSDGVPETPERPSSPSHGLGPRRADVVPAPAVDNAPIHNALEHEHPSAALSTEESTGFAGLDQQRELVTESDASNEEAEPRHTDLHSSLTSESIANVGAAPDSADGSQHVSHPADPVVIPEPVESTEVQDHHQPPASGSLPEPAPLQDETPFMTPGLVSPAEDFPFDRDAPSRMSSVATDAFGTPMEELDTPRLGPQTARDNDVEELAQHPTHDPVASLGEESFASDRTFGEDSIASNLSSSAETEHETRGDPVHLAGVAAGLPTTSSNQFLRSQEAQVDNLYAPDSSHDMLKLEDHPVAPEDVDAGVPLAPTAVTDDRHRDDTQSP